MQTQPVFGVVLFYTQSAALRAEKKLLGHGLSVKLIPTPRELSSDCGVALRFYWNEVDHVRALLQSTGIEAETIQKLER